MTTAAQYEHQIAGLNLQNIPLQGLNKSQAQESLEKLLGLQQRAMEIERALKLDLHVIRAQYQPRIAAATAGITSRVNISDKHRVGGKMRAEELEKVTAERDEKMAPLERLEKQVEEILAKIAVDRADLEEQAGKTA
ncbi:MAG TPA: hypothetical protein VMT46_17220 [Anaerolineaceae bacterium]|nr:hypothetical protein [Anaerolineaceae bacterium]